MPPPQPLTIIESPYAGNISLHLTYARAALRDSIFRGETPMASHLLYTQPGVLRDNIAVERHLGLTLGWHFYTCARLCAVYADHGISKGMQEGISVAQKLAIPVEYRYLSTPPSSPPTTDINQASAAEEA